MARASITVNSQHEGDAVKLAMGHPAIKAASVITGLLLQLPSSVRPTVMQIVEQQLVVALPLFDDDEPAVLGAGIGSSSNGDDQLRLLDGSGTSGTGE